MTPEAIKELLADADTVLSSNGPSWESEAEWIITRLADAIRELT